MLNKNLIDPWGRRIDYLRLSVTDRCNLRCTYCMAEDMVFLPKAEILSIEELYEIGQAFVALGCKKIRLTGGEPLVRNGIDELTAKLHQLDGLQELTLTSNGVLLSQHASQLAQAGVQRINISLDTLDPDQYQKIARVGKLTETLAGIQAAQQHGMRVKLNSVILRGENDAMILPLVDFAVDNELDITFIEEMPLGHITSHERKNTMIFSDEVQAIVSEKYQLNSSDYHSGGPAKYQQIANTSSRLGFISPHSNNFCASCNRVRVTVQGQLLLCLGHENAVDLRAILRADNYSQTLLQQTIVTALESKPEKHDFAVETTHIVRFMNMTGG